MHLTRLNGVNKAETITRLIPGRLLGLMGGQEGQEGSVWICSQAADPRSLSTAPPVLTFPVAGRSEQIPTGPTLQQDTDL